MMLGVSAPPFGSGDRQHGPMRMQAIRRIGPFAVDHIAAVGGAGARRHAERAHEAHVGIALEHLALRLVAKQRGDPYRRDRDEGHPRRRAAAAAELGHDVHVSAQIAFEAAKALRRPQPEQLRRIEGGENVVGNAPLALGLGRLGAQQRHQCGCLRHQRGAQRLLPGGGVLGAR